MSEEEKKKKKKKKGMAQQGSSLNMVINEHKSKFFEREIRQKAEFTAHYSNFHLLSKPLLF